MKLPSRVVLLLPLSLAAAPFSGCAAVQEAVSGFNTFSVADDMELGRVAYHETLAESAVVSSGPQAEQVRRVTARLVEAALVDAPGFARDFAWEATLIDAPDTVNAFCLPGGKMAVYTGILPVAQSDAGLAVVMGHEIAHATLRHGTKAVSRQQVFAGGIAALDLILRGSDRDPEYATAAAAVGTALVGLKFGRSAELEADRVGLITMARAGYDPREAVGFWQRMAAQSGGGQGPEFLSTHPSHGNRIEQIESLLPEALAIYQAGSGTP